MSHNENQNLQKFLKQTETLVPGGPKDEWARIQRRIHSKGFLRGFQYKMASALSVAAVVALLVASSVFLTKGSKTGSSGSSDALNEYLFNTGVEYVMDGSEDAGGFYEDYYFSSND